MKLKEKLKYKILQKTYRKRFFGKFPTSNVKDELDEVDEYLKEKFESIDLKARNTFNSKNKRG